MNNTHPELSPSQLRWIDRHLSIEDGRACIGKELWDIKGVRRINLQGTPAEVRHFLESIVADYVPLSALTTEQQRPQLDTAARALAGLPPCTCGGRASEHAESCPSYMTAICDDGPDYREGPLFTLETRPTAAEIADDPDHIV